MRTARKQVSLLSIVPVLGRLTLARRIFHSMDPDGLVWLKAQEDWLPVMGKKDVDNLQAMVVE